jgi:hypothetical protein
MRTLSPSTATKLFATGFTVGPVVDSLHNQCLLKYDMLPISLAWPLESSALFAQFSDYPYFFCSSWTVPPLLGIAYVVLGGILPRIFEALLPQPQIATTDAPHPNLQSRAFLAVATTALIIKLSEFLETHPGVVVTEAHLVCMLVAAVSQWAILDGTLAALMVASITSIGGPLSELPFVANGVWEYLPQASDYLPLMNVPPNNGLLELVLGENYQTLALSSITGPCYFAVTMDAIALGRWFDASSEKEESETS